MFKLKGKIHAYSTLTGRGVVDVADAAFPFDKQNLIDEKIPVKGMPCEVTLTDKYEVKTIKLL